jgi:hypothetical protein
MLPWGTEPCVAVVGYLNTPYVVYSCYNVYAMVYVEGNKGLNQVTVPALMTTVAVRI